MLLVVLNYHISYLISHYEQARVNRIHQGTVTYPTKNIPTSEKMESPKQEPTFQMYIDNSTESSITYKYKINDPDQALWKEKDERS